MSERFQEQRLEELHPASFGWAVQCCGGDRQEAEDVLQTTYLKVLDGRGDAETARQLRAANPSIDPTRRPS